jgi:plastocyanin
MKPFDLLRSPFRLRWFLTVAVLVAPHVVQAQSWQATVGAQNNDKGRQALAFLPNEIWIHAGDSITWKVPTDEAHTVTFLKTAPPAQVRPPFSVGCPGGTADGSPFDGTACVNSDVLVAGQTFTVTFPTAGNYTLVCLIHRNMTGIVHVLPLSEALPHDQDFYDETAEDEQQDLLSDRDSDEDHRRRREHSASAHSHGQVSAGTGEIVATPGGSQTLSVMRFDEPDIVIHAGEIVEWTNSDPATAHTITFGAQPANPIPPSSNVTLDADLARHAVINLPTDNVHSGFVVAASQERIGLVQSPLPPLPGGTVTRFRVTFTHPGTFPYVCALHDGLGMTGKVIVLP